MIADDHEMLRYGVRRLLEDAPDFAVVGEARDAEGALKLALEHRPSLVLLDIGMPGMSPFEAGRLIEERCAGTRVVYTTMHEDREYVRQALGEGIGRYLLKDTPAPLLLRALREVYRGGRSLSPQIQTKLPGEATRPDQPAHVPLRRSALTLREREVMKLLAEGHTVTKGSGRSGNQRQDRGGAQVQPDAQTRHPQQGPAGHGRHTEEDPCHAGSDVDGWRLV